MAWNLTYQNGILGERVEVWWEDDHHWYALALSPTLTLAITLTLTLTLSLSLSLTLTLTLTLTRYGGTVRAFDVISGSHTVVYDDGTRGLFKP